MDNKTELVQAVNVVYFVISLVRGYLRTKAPCVFCRVYGNGCIRCEFDTRPVVFAFGQRVLFPMPSILEWFRQC